jgi:hypothetical protein
VKFPYKADFEKEIENWFRSKGNPVVKATVSDDGKTATVKIGDEPVEQFRMSPKAQERIRTGREVFLVGDEQFLLPMDEPKKQ